MMNTRPDETNGTKKGESLRQEAAWRPRRPQHRSCTRTACGCDPLPTLNRITLQIKPSTLYRVSLSLRLKDLLGPVTKVKKNRGKQVQELYASLTPETSQPVQCILRTRAGCSPIVRVSLTLEP